jgi:hypothetical protein
MDGVKGPVKAPRTGPAPAVPLAEDLTATWLTDALGLQVDAVAAEVVGTGQMGSCHRLFLVGDPALPTTVLAKIPSEDAGTRETMAGAYANEVRFYTDLAPTVDIKVPHCYFAAMGDAGTFTLLLEDLAPAQVGEQIAGCSPEQALGAAVNLAGLHGPRWCDPTLTTIDGMLPLGKQMGDMLDLTFPPAAESFIEMLGDQMSAADVETLTALVPLVGRWIAARAERFALLHMDYRLDNLLFDLGGPDVHAVDWQGISIGLPLRDVAFFLSTGLMIEDRRAHETDIVAAYHQKLSGYDIGDYSFEQCWDDYRLGLVQNPFITVFGCVYGTRTERGDRMFLAMIERGCAAIRDLDVISLLAVEPEAIA